MYSQNSFSSLRNAGLRRNVKPFLIRESGKFCGTSSRNFNRLFFFRFIGGKFAGLWQYCASGNNFFQTFVCQIFFSKLLKMRFTIKLPLRGISVTLMCTWKKCSIFLNPYTHSSQQYYRIKKKYITVQLASHMQLLTQKLTCKACVRSWLRWVGLFQIRTQTFVLPGSVLKDRW